ncbi:MAG: hypothetical protein RLZZ09_1875 [Pseudomonadota bacterium]|jgi:hypothetical protein
MTVLGISSSSAIAAGTDHLKIKSAEAEWEGLEKSVGLEVDTNVAIPMEGKSGAFGFGALTDGTNNVLVLTTHLPIDDSSHEHATSGFQTHVLDFKRPALHVPGANFEVDLEGSAKNSAFDANNVWSI